MTNPTGTRAARRRPELAAYLRSRRARITPEDVGMPPGPRRRTPGLRREEVAQLAGVGVTWYTWLEQGRPINASPQVLDAVARTLRLDTAERAQLYQLAEVPMITRPGPGSTLPEDLPLILAGLEPLPVAVSNDRSDLLAWNGAYAALFPYLVKAPEDQRNSLWMTFTAPPCCNPVVNLAEAGPLFVAAFRRRYTRNLDEPGWRDFVQRLCAASPEFARLWATQDVVDPAPRSKVFRHASVGEIATRATAFEIGGTPGACMVVYTPVDEDGRKRVEWLMQNPETPVHDHWH